MTAESLSNGTIGSLGLQNQGRNWVTKGSTRNVNDQYSATRTSQTKLLFNEAIPLSAINRATRVGPPAPIVIERLLPCSEMRESVGSLKHSCNFSVLSEERLQAAVKLAKRDLRRRHFESLAKTSAKPLQESSVFETCDVKLLQELIASPGRTQLKEKKDQTDVKQQTSKKKATSVMARVGQSPPTRDPGLRQLEAGKQGHLSSEILKLHNELETCIRKVEELAHRGEKTEESLEPEEQNKWEIRRQKQAANSARTIYVLQRQVKEIQDDIEKLRREKMWDEKKSVAINRLAAAHRGALRALQVVIHQLSDQAQTKVHPHYKELGQLIRQLSLCSAKVEVDQGSDVPQTALDILQKLEILDSALSKHDMLEKMQARAHPPPRKSPHRSTSPTSGPKSLSVFTAQGHRKPPNPRGGRSFALQRPKKVPNQPLNKRELLTVGLQSIIQQRELKQPLRQSQPNTKYQRRRHAERKKASKTKHNQMQEAGFQQPTVSSQLRVNQMPQKEKSVPWMPTSPHSPPQQRVPQRGRPEPRCLFSPIKPSASPPGEQQAEGQLEAERNQSSPKMKAAHNEAIRRAYQEKMTKQRVTRLSGEEVTPKHRLRSEVALQNQWAEEAEQGVRERSQGLSNRIQQEGAARNRPDKLRKIQLPEVTAERAVGDCGWLGESVGDLLEDSSSDSWAAGTGRRLDDKAGFGQQAPTLESMLLRMEEIQRDEEEVRRRFASIAYSDTLYWDRSRTAGSQAQAPRSRPASPQPIRLTRPVLKQTSAADIFLEKPIEAGTLFEKNLTEDLMVQPLATNRVSSDKLEKNMTVLSVPCGTLKNIRRYKEDYNTYLQSVSHGVKDSFNTWVITESLAEEILSEALVDVAKEFQEVVEEYAEAIFTSEFLQPIQSPPASALSS